MKTTVLIDPCLRRINAAIEGDARFSAPALLNVVADTSEEVVMKILAHFCESLRDAARAISSSLETENFEQAWKACHKIAGTAELLGFSELGRVSRSLSVSVKDGGVTSSEDIAQLTGHASACLEYRDLIVRNFGNWKEYL